MQPQSLQVWLNAERLLSAQQYVPAQAAYQSLLTTPELAALAHLRLSLIASQQGRHRDATGHALGAYAARQSDPDLMDLICKRLFTLGELEAAIDCATSPAVLGTNNPIVTAELGKLMSDASLPEVALKLLHRSRQNGLDSAAVRYLIGISQLYAGDPESAQRELESCLSADPDFARAYWSLSKLRTQTPDNNHLDQLRASLARVGSEHPDSALLQYALFKELDDLGELEPAWQALSEAMRLRRRRVRHDPAAQEALFTHLLGLHATPPADREGAAATGPVPIFIVGMPRTGTTLLERILGSHSEVADAGELHDFTWQLRWMCDRAGGPYLNLDLAQRAEGIDWPTLGERYLSHTRWRAKGKAFYTDKMPANFIHIANIVRALPQARIVHMIRDPMDTCFSNLKEFFAGPYAHSYDQIEMADHYRHYRQLMGHWHSLFPGRILDVRYSELIADPESVARGVFGFCGLPWEDGVVEIEKRQGVVATASATQVREPIHRRSVAQWRKYEAHLAPLRERLGSYA